MQISTMHLDCRCQLDRYQFRFGIHS